MEELQIIQNKIYEVRGQRVMLDRDLAELYGVTTSALNQTVKRNIERFPDRFMFQLTKEECLRFQIGILDDSSGNQESGNLKSQIVISSWGGRRKLPYVFTEQGVSMLSAVLKSPTAVKVCITIMDAFVTLRSQLVSGSAVAAEVERRYCEQLEALERKFETQHDALVRRLGGLDVSLEILEDKFENRLSGMRSWLDSLDDRCFMSELERDARRPHPGCLDMATWIEEYSPRALVIFTVVKSDRFLLKSIGARFNPWLTWQGRRSCGWILPKSRGKELLSILPAGYDVCILERACGNADRSAKVCRETKK